MILLPIILTTILTGIGLSMDALSLSILYGTLSLSKKKTIQLSVIVGLFHFFMPLFGYYFGKMILNIIFIDAHVLIGVIFSIIAIQMFLSLSKEEEVLSLTNIYSLLLFGFTVSIDSFSIGIGLSAMNQSIYISSFVFSILSSIFTLIGLILGNKLNKTFGNISVLIGSFILLSLGVYYFFF